MPVYTYTARSKTGEILKGSYETADKATVVAMVKNKGYLPLDIKEKSTIGEKYGLNLFSKGVTTKEISIFCRQFSAVMDAGIPVLECLDIVRKQTEAEKLREILHKVYEQVQKGRSLSESMKEHKDYIPSMMIHMIEAGEASGTLDIVMGRLAIYYANANKLISKVKGAMTYPIIILIVTFIAILVLLWKVVPQFQIMFASMDAKLPLITVMLIKLSDFVKNNIIWIFLFLAAAASGIAYYIKTPKGRFMLDKLIFKIPKISAMYRKMIAARFSRTMATLLAAGLPLIQAIEITDRVINNTIMSKYLEKVREDITKGVKFSIAIAEVSLFPIMVTSMASIGEESGSIDMILDKTADFFEEETEAAIATLTTMIEPAIIVLMAIVVGGLVVSIVTPMFDLMKNAQNL